MVGIGVDTLSLDPGNSATFDVHFGFLGSGRYGVKNLANLDTIPARGATAFVGAVPPRGGFGRAVPGHRHLVTTAVGRIVSGSGQGVVL